MSDNPRFDLDGELITATLLTVRCGECGMRLTSYRELHPYEACAVFKEKHESREVLRMLARKKIAEPADA